MSISVVAARDEYARAVHAYDLDDRRPPHSLDDSHDAGLAAVLDMAVDGVRRYFCDEVKVGDVSTWVLKDPASPDYHGSNVFQPFVTDHRAATQDIA